MAQTIISKQSGVSTDVPTTAQLSLGELAINTFDGKVFIKKNNGVESIVELVTGGAVTPASFIKQTGSSTLGLTSSYVNVDLSVNLISASSGDMSYSSGVFTVSEAGNYEFGGFVAINNSIDERAAALLQIFVDGVATGFVQSDVYFRNAGGSMQDWTMKFADEPFALTAGQTIEVRVRAYAAHTNTLLLRHLSQYWLKRMSGDAGAQGIQGIQGIQGNLGGASAIASSTPTAGATDTLDLSASNEFRIQMPAGNITVALSNESSATRFLVSITQDATGSRAVTWFSAIKWVGGTIPLLTITANKRDTFGFIRTGANTYDGFVVGSNI